MAGVRPLHYRIARISRYSKGEACGFHSLHIPYDTKKKAGGKMSYLLRFTDSAIIPITRKS